MLLQVELHAELAIRCWFLNVRSIKTVSEDAAYRCHQANESYATISDVVMKSWLPATNRPSVGTDRWEANLCRNFDYHSPTTCPSFRAPKFRQTCKSRFSLTVRTEPSINSALTTPVWKLRDVTAA